MRSHAIMVLLSFLARLVHVFLASAFFLAYDSALKFMIEIVLFVKLLQGWHLLGMGQPFY